MKDEASGRLVPCLYLFVRVGRDAAEDRLLAAHGVPSHCLSLGLRDRLESSFAHDLIPIAKA